MDSRTVMTLLLTAGGLANITHAEEPTPAERGKQALLGKSYNPPVWSHQAIDTVWRDWGISEKPTDYEAAFRERYGLHPAPYPNDDLPMGLRKSSWLVIHGVSIDCMACHGGSIMGKSYVGLGNASGDVHALFDELNRASGIRAKLPFQFSQVRGTSEAGGMSVYLLGLRHPDLSLRNPPLDLGLDDEMCEDVPAWWLLKKKKTMYHTGGADARSHRSIMQFMMTPTNTRTQFDQAEEDFRDILEYIKSIEAPKYPLPIDRPLAKQGHAIFDAKCASCHGTYSDEPTYPNRIVPLDVIGTDSVRYYGVSQKFGDYYNQTWFAKEKPDSDSDGYPVFPSKGYQAPPLDGIWATAPYLHNGSVPTVYHVLKSDARPTMFTRSYRTEADDYDPVRLGWKYREVDAIDPRQPAIERRKIYDTRKRGRGNAGHTFGDDLSESERMAVIEYLKTL